jgi:hypothetical protein
VRVARHGAYRTLREQLHPPEGDGRHRIHSSGENNFEPGSHFVLSQASLEANTGCGCPGVHAQGDTDREGKGGESM